MHALQFFFVKEKMGQHYLLRCHLICRAQFFGAASCFDCVIM
jgi:hypothetical protein